MLGSADPDAGRGFGERLAATLDDTRYGSLWLVRIGLVLVYAAALLANDWGVPWRRRPLAWLTWGWRRRCRCRSA